MHRFWRKYKKAIINGAIVLAMVGLIVIFELISAAKMDDGAVAEPAEGTPVVDQDAQEEEQTPVSLPLVMNVATMSDGEILTLGENCIKKNKEMIFEAQVEELGTIILRHGERTMGVAWLTLDAKKIEVYTYDDEATRQLSVEHGLVIEGQRLRVQLSVKANETLSLSVSAGDKLYTCNEIAWSGCKGKIEVESIGNELSDVQVSWDALDIEKDIWVLGDNYLGSRWKNRWPYYLAAEGYDTMLYTGYPGATSQSMYKEWENLLNYGTPKYAVWCLGMNDGDSSTGINMTWRAKLQLFLADCKKLGITPILATIPSTPLVNNTFKNEYVRESGYRYIDFAVAVGGGKKNSLWLEGMLSTDQIHPTTVGAEALANRVIKDFPEIIGKEKEEE